MRIIGLEVMIFRWQFWDVRMYGWQAGAGSDQCNLEVVFGLHFGFEVKMFRLELRMIGGQFCDGSKDNWMTVLCWRVRIFG